MSEIDRIIEGCIGDEVPCCQAACPLHVDVKGSIALISQGKFDEALELIRQKNPLLAVCSRVCTHPCETECTRGKVDKPVAIRDLKFYIADYELGIGTKETTPVPQTKEERVAIVGSGPAGLSAAYSLLKLGYGVTIFEALTIPGGMLAVGIPEYRLPKKVLQKEIEYIQALGVEIKLGSPVGKDGLAVDDLWKRGYKAIFIATGAHDSVKLNVSGADLDGIYYGVPFLRDINLEKEVEVGERVIVIGGGSVAIDCARSALRLGAKVVHLVCLETRDTTSNNRMPAYEWELEKAEEEGINIHDSLGIKGISSKDGRVIGLETQVCVSVYEEGRFAPKLSEEPGPNIEGDTVIIAIGQCPEISPFTKDFRLNEDGTFQADPITLQTNVKGIFAGGDVVTGPKTVIDALAAGRKAAISIDRYLKGEDLALGRKNEGAQKGKLVIQVEGVVPKKRVPMPTLPISQRIESFQEVDLGFSEEEAVVEAQRCLSCECKVCVNNCEFLKEVCQSPKELAERFSNGYFEENPQVAYYCNLCNLCEKLCPNDLNIGKACLEIRRHLVKNLGTLPAHKPLKRDQEWRYQNFTLAIPGAIGSKSVFFPGCTLSGYSPSLVIKVYEYLRERLPGTGMILGCCGKPMYALGEEVEFEKILKGIEFDIERLGISEIIAACPGCYHILKSYISFPLKSVYEVIAEEGLPELVKKGKHTFSLHDSCITRYEKPLQESVRTIIKQMGYQIEEMEYSRDKARCCGMGGMVAYTNLKVSNKIGLRRVQEAKFDMLTYCASCREAFAFLGKPSLHLLDLIFTPDWEKERLRPATTEKERRENQAFLKSQLEVRRL